MHYGRICRRLFIRGIGAAGAALALGVAPPLTRHAIAGQAGSNPVPIPGGNPDPLSGLIFHAFGPGPGNLNDEPSTISNFDGLVGLAYISGTCTRTNVNTGESRSLPFMNNDMRFMSGRYQGADG